MKPNTPVWIEIHNVGKPADYFKAQLSTREAILTIGEKLMGLYMGQRITIVLARDESELELNRRASTVQNMMNDLESIVNGTGAESD